MIKLIPEDNWDGTISDKEMLNCEDRLKTFKNWPKYIMLTPEECAEAGFIYCNVSDRVRCFWCNIILKDWEPTDIAWNEHIKWSPNCPFIKLCKQVIY